MSHKRQALLSTIRAANNIAIATGNMKAVLTGLNAYAAVESAPDTVAIPAARFAHLIGASTPLATRVAA